jgi:hypothetical protein
MAEPERAPQAQGIHSSLHALAQSVRDAPALGREAQQALAELLDELSRAVAAGQPAESLAPLAASATQLVQAIGQQDQGLIAAARQRLAHAVFRAEAQAPVAAGIVERLLDALSSIGI